MKIKDITLRSNKEIEILESAINFLNKELFDNELSKIKVTIAIRKHTHPNIRLSPHVSSPWTIRFNIRVNSIIAPV